MKIKLLFIGFLFIPLFSLSQEMKTVKGSMKDKTSAKFVLSDHDGCAIIINRSILSKNQEGILLESYIDSNWEGGEVISVAVPADALSGGCVMETVIEIYAEKQAADVFLAEGNDEDEKPFHYQCDSPKYLAAKARVDDYNSKLSAGEVEMSVLCFNENGNDRDAINIPDCDSEEYREQLREAEIEAERVRRAGGMAGYSIPCRGGNSNSDGSQQRSSRGVR